MVRGSLRARNCAFPFEEIIIRHRRCADSSDRVGENVPALFGEAARVSNLGGKNKTEEGKIPSDCGALRQD
jgi:hypothetical protein